MLYILFPTEPEAAPFIEGIDGLRAASIAGRRAYTGSLSGRDVSVVLCGIGQANAAQSAASVMDSGGARLVVLGGCAGAYQGSGLGVGDVAVATAETYAGLGIDAPGGFMTLDEAGLPLVERGDERYFAAMPLPAVSRLDPSVFTGLGFSVVYGGFLTVSTITGTSERGRELFSRYGALCENMEGAAAAQVALHYKTDFIELRGVSNMVEDRDRSSWDIHGASMNCAAAIDRVIGTWRL